MKLSEISKETFSDDEIQKIVFSGIYDSEINTEYALVFGNSLLIKERVMTAFEAYKKGRFKKIIFSGGINGASNQDNDIVPEAIKMKNMALSLGINEEDILIDAESNNSFENVENSFKMLPKDIKSITIITSEFHLKRCLAIIKKMFLNVEVIMIASKDGYSDSDNWFLSDGSWNSGRSLVTYEANLLVKYAKNKQIFDLEIEDF